MTRRLKRARVEHIKYTIDGTPDREVLDAMYRIVILAPDMKGSRPVDRVQWVGEVNASLKEINRLQKRVEKIHGITIDNTISHVTIYSPITSKHK